MRPKQLLFTFLLSFVVTQIAFADREKIGTILAIQGQLSAKDSFGNIRELTIGDPVFGNEKFLTNTGTKAQFLLTDGTLMSVSEQSVFEVNEYVFNKTEDDRLRIQIDNGTIRLLPGETETKNGGMEILTPEGTVTPTGTHYTASAYESGTSVGFFRGSGQFKNLAGKLLLGAGESYDFTFLPGGLKDPPKGQLLEPIDLAALDGGGSGDFSVPSQVSSDILESFEVESISVADLRAFKKRIEMGGYFSDRAKLRVFDRQVQRHAHGIHCRCK